MKAEIDQHGILCIKAETPLESYALNKWCDSNFSKPNESAINTQNITIQTGFESK